MQATKIPALIVLENAIVEAGASFPLDSEFVGTPVCRYSPSNAGGQNGSTMFILDQAIQQHVFLLGRWIPAQHYATCSCVDGGLRDRHMRDRSRRGDGLRGRSSHGACGFGSMRDHGRHSVRPTGERGCKDGLLAFSLWTPEV